MKRIIPILFLISILSPIASSQGQPETPQWTIDWVTDMKRPVEFESSSPSYAKEIWISLEFYVENTRPTPVSLVLEFEWDEDNQLEVTFEESKIEADGNSNTTYYIDIRSSDSDLIESLDPKTPLPFTLTAQEEISDQAISGQSQEIEGSVIMTPLHELLLNTKWVNPVNAGSWSNTTIEIINDGNSDDAVKEASVDISGCPQLSVSGEEDATGVVIKPEQTYSFDLRVEASSSHPERQCSIELTVKSEGDDEYHRLKFSVSVKHPKSDGSDDDSPKTDDETADDDLKSESSSLSGFTFIELFFALFAVLCLQQKKLLQ